MEVDRGCMVRRQHLLAAIAAMLLLVVGVSPATAEDWLVRTWTYTGGGAVDVTLDNGTYTGTVTSPITFSQGGCTHPTGERIWVVTSRGNHSYHGAMSAFWSDCTPAPGTVDLVVSDNGGSLALDMCLVGGTGCRKFEGGATPADTNEPPVIKILGSNSAVPLGTRPKIVYTVDDPSGEAFIITKLYSDGTLLYSDGGLWLEEAHGQIREKEYDVYGSMFGGIPSGTHGPYAFCVEAADRERHATGAWDNCNWLTIEVPLKAVSNGCGPQINNKTLAGLVNFMLNVRKIYDPQRKTTFTVNFGPACDNHDAGYSGATITDQVNGGLIDYRKWSRKAVDVKFYNDIGVICRRSIKATIAPKALHTCEVGYGFTAKAEKGGVGSKAFWNEVLAFKKHATTWVGAGTYYEAVRIVGGKLYDSDATVPGDQKITPASDTRPSGGARAND